MDSDIIIRIGLIVFAFTFAFAFFGEATGKGASYFFMETVKVIKSIFFA